MKKIVFACVHNAGRSQMAAAFFNRIVDPKRAAALSAGTHPAPQVHPEVVQAMREHGIDLSAAIPQRLTREMVVGAGWLITMGCGDECPILPGVRREDWPFADPQGLDLDAVCAIREQVRARVEAFARREGLAEAPTISAATHDELPAILAFLASNGLPEAGLAEHATDLLVARQGSELIGTAALEIYGHEALLRSVAVSPYARGTGLGISLTLAALERARRGGAARVFLLTETAPVFFRKFGFADVDRGFVPDSIRATVEFGSACPASARVMALELS